MIDISARDNRRAGQWIYSKGQDTYAPFGPCIVTADEIPDPQTLDLWLTVNGVEKQHSNTRHMLFKVDALIADISPASRWSPATSSPPARRKASAPGATPQEWLWPGDVVVAGVEGIGRLRHPVVASPRGEAECAMTSTRWKSRATSSWRPPPCRAPSPGW